MHSRTMISAAPRKGRPRAGTGQGLVGYALSLALIAIISITATLFLGNSLSDTLTGIGNDISGTITHSPAAPTPTPAPTPDPASSYTKKKTCKTAGYTWVTKPKPAHCT